ncbi:MAG: FxsA family protein [Idiomarina sp.]|nr:FxsA family protein [Idiomarina sp.]
MFFPLLLIFVVVPLLEIWVLIQVGQVIGGLNTIALLVITAIIGAALVKRQGIKTLQQAQLRMARGEMPGREMASGVLIFVAGLMFVTPGFLTDVVAILLLLPPVQLAVGLWLMKHIQVRGATGAQFHFHAGGGNRSPDQNTNGRTFDGDFERSEQDAPRQLSDDEKK